MANHAPYILAMFKRPGWREIVGTMVWPGLASACQLPGLYFAIKDGNGLRGGLYLFTLVCFTFLLIRNWAWYSRLATGGPALWLDRDELVASLDKTVRISVADIQSYKITVAPKSREPLELKLGLRNGKTQRLSLYALDDIQALLRFIRHTVPARAQPAN